MTSIQYDVVVVGAGTAGIPCAIKAADAGARVLLIDKDSQVGGTLHTTGGHLSAAETARQAEKDISDTVAQHREEVERISGGSVRGDLVDRAIELAPETVDWLDDLGFDFAPETPRIVYGHEPYDVPRTYYSASAGLGILAVLRPLLDAHISNGRIDLRTDTPITGLLTDEDGRVVGIRIWAGTDEQDIGAKAVVLATGGFAASPELFAEIEGVPLVSAAHRTSTGDGLVLARELGAAIAGKGTYLPSFGGLPHPTTPDRAQWSDRPLLVAAERQPWEIYVDRHGSRFVAEDDPSMDHKERVLATDVEDMAFWTIFDDRARRESVPMIVGWSPQDVADRANKRAGLHCHTDLKDLAEAAGIDPEGLVSAVETYNAATEADEPDEFGRTHRPAPITESPFYAMENHGISLISFAGLDVDSDLTVRREDGSTIAGLYAVGEVLGAGATCGNSFCSGMLVTPAITLGRWLGRELGQETTSRSSVDVAPSMP